jgi:hypothetical protein
MTEQEILDNAPEGATHFSYDFLYLRYSEDQSNYWWSLWLSDLSKWVDKVAVANGLRSLSDIKRIAELEDGLETERCRLEACGVVANANTRETAAKQRVMHEDYKSASLLDVIRAVDTEIKQRERIAELEKEVMGIAQNYMEQQKEIERLETEIAQIKAAQPELMELQHGVYEDVCNTLDEIMVVHHMTLNYYDPRKSINELLNIVSDISEYFTAQKSQPEWIVNEQVIQFVDFCINKESMDKSLLEVAFMHYVKSVLPAPPEKGQ